jgi:basic amino acid/polyamine antiporter, APA family
MMPVRPRAVNDRRMAEIAAVLVPAPPPRFLRDAIVAIVALVFSVLFVIYSRNTGHSFWVYWAPFILAGVALVLGIPVFRAQRRHITPVDTSMPPPYR